MLPPLNSYRYEYGAGVWGPADGNYLRGGVFAGRRGVFPHHGQLIPLKILIVRELDTNDRPAAIVGRLALNHLLIANFKRDALARPINEAEALGRPREHVPLVEQRAAVVLHNELLGELPLHGNLSNTRCSGGHEISTDGFYP